MRKRISFDSLGFVNFQNPPSPPAEGDNTGSSLVPALYFDLRGENLPGFYPRNPAVVEDFSGKVHSAMAGHPATSISFNFPAAEEDKVRSWFINNNHDGGVTESSTLLNARRAAVSSTLSSYRQGAVSRNLFTSPFKLGWRLRMKNGEAGPLIDIRVMGTNMSAPKIPIFGYSIAGNTLSTDVEIRNIPAALHLRIPAEALPLLRNGGAERIEVFTTRQTPLYPENMGVAGVRTSVVDSTNTRCWIYDTFSTSDIETSLNSDSDFRQISSIPIASLPLSAGGAVDMKVPMAIGTLGEFDRLPKFSVESGKILPALFLPGACDVISEPFCINLPDEEATVRSARLCGVFNRRDMEFTLYASRCRERWFRVATARGDTIPYLHGARFPWWKIRIKTTLRAEDRSEGVMFD